ncbi:MAG: hypothetical protein AB7F86_01865 [Bdellovibrionales bacterium]
MRYYQDLKSLAQKTFPSLGQGVEVAWEYLVSPLELKLPPQVVTTAQEAIRAFYQITREESYRQSLPPVDGISRHGSNHQSVLMAYDFHTNEAGDCFLVEINTNASGFLMASLAHMMKTGQRADDFQPLQQLASSFRQELQQFSGATQAHTAIVDDQILEQKMYPEFLMYQDFFTGLGWTSELNEVADLHFADGKLRSTGGKIIDFVYNRSTDFYLEAESSAALKQALLSDAACVSPNPYEYWLMADKERLIRFSSVESPAIQKVLIPTFEKSSFETEEQIWSERRQLFFKPRRSHGGKSVYRGESVSKKVFERLMADPDILIQRFAPAQKVPTDDERSVLNNWKFDLRFYVYRDEIQLAIARTYQGQVTNFASQHGGFTFVQF